MPFWPASCCSQYLLAVWCLACPALPFSALQAGHGLGADEARLAVAALQCLQRLAGASVVASQVCRLPACTALLAAVLPLPLLPDVYCNGTGLPAVFLGS
jgi:hypothetical protein